MAFQPPITIAQAINNIKSNKYLLPAIQREFVWDYKKIEWLFDSIMRDYPIASFLFWEVQRDTASDHRFYSFLKNYRERYETHNPEQSTAGEGFTAILDGQQRLTSLYIGLCGSYAYRKKFAKEENSERCYPTRYLYLNMKKDLKDEEDGRIYEFKFKTPDEVKSLSAEWFPVSKILELGDIFQFNKLLREMNLEDNEFSTQILSQLQQSIHGKSIINFFLEKEQDIDKALNIFIRTNSGGQPLDFSDLLLSIAVANWSEKDARKVIHELVDTVWDKGFGISKDFVLKTFLFLHSKDIKFKVTNFSKENAKSFEERWDDIRDVILTVFDLIKTYGFVDSTLISKNALLPIIYYLYHHDIYQDFVNKTEHERDRQVIKKWLHIVLVKKLLGGSSDATLTQIRRAFTPDVTKVGFLDEELTEFPVTAITKEIRRDVGVTDEFIEDLLYTEVGDKYAFSILALLYPNLDYKNNDFHKDHMHPLANYDGENFDWYDYNSIINLQMLDANENKSKQDKSLAEWVESKIQKGNRSAFYNRQLIPNVDLDIQNFNDFAEVRKKLLAEKLKEVLTE